MKSYIRISPNIYAMLSGENNKPKKAYYGIF